LSHKENIDGINNYQIGTYNFAGRPGWRRRCDNVSIITDMKKYIPWYLECNQGRYPYWFGKLDPRNDILQEALQEYFANNS